MLLQPIGEVRTPMPTQPGQALEDHARPDTMRPQTYSADVVAALLRDKTIATMPEIMAALGTSVERTVFRKLSALRYRTSYSHRGRYYALDELARFDSLGLWSYRSVWFSAHGSLVDTAAALVDCATAGYFVDELDEALHVKTKDCLRQLAERGRVGREGLDRRHLYCSADEGRRRAQVAARRARLGASASRAAAGAVPDELRATLILFVGLLDERQRRLFCGLESLKLGRGGDVLVAQMLGLDPATVAKGRRELLEGQPASGRVRRAGGGRKPVEKKRPESPRGSRIS